MTHKQKVVREAMDRLRKLVKDRTVFDQNGAVRYEGTLIPMDVEAELRRVYQLAARRAREASRS